MLLNPSDFLSNNISNVQFAFVHLSHKTTDFSVDRKGRTVFLRENCAFYELKEGSITCICGVFKVSATISVDSSSESVSRKVEKVSQNVDMDTMPVCFGDFKKCTVNFNFK